MTDTFEGMRFTCTGQQGRKIAQCTHISIISSVISSSLTTFAFTDAPMHDLFGMSLSFILGFKYMMKLHTASQSTKQNG
jgi:hypothetical protein